MFNAAARPAPAQVQAVKWDAASRRVLGLAPREDRGAAANREAPTVFDAPPPTGPLG